jgi:hypothetical protein
LGLAAASGPDGRIYAIGGTPDQTAATILRLVEAYNPSANAWTSVAPMPTARRLLATVTGLDGRIYAIGGFNGNILDTAEAYDAATNTWSTVAPMRIARAGLAAAAGPDGRIYAIGGSYNGSLSRVEVYNPAVPPRTPVAGATPGATSTATPTITSVPTSTPVPLTVHIKVGKKIVGAGQKQTIAVSTAPGAQVTITLTFPNGRGMQHHGTTSASGTLLWRFREPGETVRGRNHTVKVSVNVEDASGRSASASAKYATR